MKKIPTISKQAGLTLLEVLIALLVLAIGMAGLGALLLTALSNVHSASHFSLASAIALDFEERLWHEMALRSIDGGTTLSGAGCLTAGQLDDVASDLVAQWTDQGADADWNWTNSQRVRAPELELVLGDAVVSNSSAMSAISWQIIPLDIEWAEARFGLADDIERYQVRIPVVCRPVFDGNGT